MENGEKDSPDRPDPSPSAGAPSRSTPPVASPPAAAKNGSSAWWILLLLLLPAGLSLLALTIDPSDYGESGLVTFALACPVTGFIAAFLSRDHLKHLNPFERGAAIFGMGILFTIGAGTLSFIGCFALGGILF